ncbi:DUF4405 domain-containing protein [Desulfurobacterium sp.]
MKGKPGGSRSLVSLFLFYTMLVLFVSSVVLYITPYGRVAYWSGWKFLGLSKNQWEAVHIISGIAMIVFSIWHIVLNWKPLKGYLLKKESLISGCAVAVCVAATVAGLPPFSAVINLEQKIKRSWERRLPAPPLPHAELMTLRQLCERDNFPLQEILYTLRRKGIAASPDETLREIAIKNHLTPARVYNIVKESVGLQYRTGVGMSFGRMTLREVCLMNGLTIDRCMEKLQNHGIMAPPDDTLRSIAARNGVLPRDVAAIISQ